MRLALEISRETYKELLALANSSAVTAELSDAIVAGNVEDTQMNIMKLADEPSASEYPVTCEERYYDAASALLEEHSHLFTHKNANELGEVIQKWIDRKDDNYEPSDRDMGY